MTIKAEILTEGRIDEFFLVFEKVMRTSCRFYSAGVIDYFLGRVYTKASFLNRLKMKTQVVFLGIVKDRTSKIVGFLVADTPYGGVAFCRWLGVLEEYQRKGVGRKLVEEWTRWGKQKHCHRAIVASVAEAKGFYEKCGLEKEGFTPKGYFGVDQYRLGRIIGGVDEESFVK